MHHPNTASLLYAKILRRYRRLKQKAEVSVADGSFYRYTVRKRVSIVRRLRRMLRQLRQLETQLKLGTAAAAIAFMLSSGQANAQTTIGPFAKDNNARNPLHPPIMVNYRSHPAFGDVNGDGLIDMVVGDNDGNLDYYYNAGTKTNPKLIKADATNNPFDGIFVAAHAQPILIDRDGDQDLDLFLTVPYAYPSQFPVHYFENSGSKTTPKFDIPDNSADLKVINGFYYSESIAIADIDGDGDLDILLGSEAGDSPTYALTLFTYNQVTHKYEKQVGNIPTNPFYQFNQDTYRNYGNAVPCFVDVDGDNVLDIVIGISDDSPFNYNAGKLYYLHNEGTKTAPSFKLITGAASPFDGIDVGNASFPAFADLDGDGDPDLAVGLSGGYESTEIAYFLNKAGNFTQQQDFDSPFGGAIAPISGFRGFAAPAFFDKDNDGDLDVLIGNKYFDDLKTYQNAGTSFENDPSTATLDLLTTSDEKFYPAVGDVNGDMNEDLIMGYTNYTSYPYKSGIKYYRNQAGTLVEDAPVIPGTSAFSFSYEFRPTLGDVDGDGDADIVTGWYSDPGYLLYFQNDGSGNFTELTGSNNPFDGISYLYHVTSPVLVDIDHDGDVDLFAGQASSYYRQGYLNFFVNDAGTFTQQSGPTNNPLDFVDQPGVNAAFADIDQDGDLDAFVGDYYGIIHYYENINPAPATVTSISTLNFTENDPATTLDAGIGIDDADNDPSDIKAIIQITNNFVASEDALQFTPVGNITGSYDAVTGILTLKGFDSMANYTTALQSVTYVNTSDDPSAATRDITFYVFDLDATDPSKDSTPDGVISVTITPVNDAPTLSIAGGITYTENEAAKAILGTATIADVDNTTLTGATVSITGNFASTEDQLIFTNQNGISGSYDAGTGILTLTGSATLASYKAALESITYQNTSENPSNATRTVSYQVSDGTDQSTIQNSNITVVPVNDPPVLTSTLGAPPLYGSGPYVIDNTLSVSDLDDLNLSGATITITSGYTSATDELLFTDQSGITGSFNTGTGALTLSGTATLAEYQTALRSVTFEDTDPDGGTRDITFVVTDGKDPSSLVLQSININSKPVISPLAGTTNVGGTVTIDLSTSVSDADGNLDPASLSIVSQPPSGAVASISGMILTVDYSGVIFSGTEALTIGICDNLGACVVGPVDITVNNSPPTISSLSATIVAGGVATIDLASALSDPDGNLDLSTLNVVSQPASGAAATLQGTTLSVDYTGLEFTGTEDVTVGVCDNLGLCAQGTVSITAENNPPTISSLSATIVVGGVATIDLAPALSDPDDNLDLSTLNVVSQPASGAAATLQGTTLSVDYTGLEFTGTEDVTVGVCDNLGLCAQGNVSITVENSPPVINLPETPPVRIGSTFIIDLSSSLTDPDGNLDISTLKVISAPSSGASYTLNGTVLTVSYADLLTYSGTDEITIEICDFAGACTQATIMITVGGEIVVHNAFSPDGVDQINAFFQIDNIEAFPGNSVRIYNRWGDQVFEMSNYHNYVAGQRFEGLNSNGNQLPSGPYFYEIRIPGKKTLTGYLILKR